jgi:hypothetical protein
MVPGKVSTMSTLLPSAYLELPGNPFFADVYGTRVLNLHKLTNPTPNNS